jgi:hypothetical protein
MFHGNAFLMVRQEKGRISNTIWGDGYQLDINTPAGKQSFTSKKIFEEWFDTLG